MASASSPSPLAPAAFANVVAAAVDLPTEAPESAWRLSHSVALADLKPGDHVYVWRKMLSYQHHGIYIGGDRVVHFSHSTSAAASPKGFLVSEVSVQHFLGEGVSMSELKRVKYGASTLECFIRPPGTCSTMLICVGTRPAIIERARSWIGRCYQFGHLTDYHLEYLNCETFAKNCMSGRVFHDCVERVREEGQNQGALFSQGGARALQLQLVARTAAPIIAAGWIVGPLLIVFAAGTALLVTEVAIPKEKQLYQRPQAPAD